MLISFQSIKERMRERDRGKKENKKDKDGKNV